jgi:hypothetical protein
VLHLDEDDLVGAGVADAVRRTDRDVDGLPGSELVLGAVEGRDRLRWGFCSGA